MPWSRLGVGDSGGDWDGSLLRSVSCGDGGSSDIGHALGGGGSRMVCCGMIGCCVVVPFAGFEAICGGDVVRISLT